VIGNPSVFLTWPDFFKPSSFSSQFLPKRLGQKNPLWPLLNLHFPNIRSLSLMTAIVAKKTHSRSFIGTSIWIRLVIEIVPVKTRSVAAPCCV
jgi:hypothetical protein